MPRAAKLAAKRKNAESDGPGSQDDDTPVVEVPKKKPKGKKGVDESASTPVASKSAAKPVHYKNWAYEFSTFCVRI